MIPVKEYASNRDKMANYIRQAKDQGCRLVIFPERALHFKEDVPLAEVEAAIDHLRTVSDEADIYSVICSWRHDGVKPHNQLVVADPDGRIIHTYNKIWSDDRFTEAPGLFSVDGVLCCGTICADRWVRSVEELPAMAGAKILIECSNNYDNEWIDELGWYWYVPRALRNEAFVIFSNTSANSYMRPADLPGHGHSAVVAPDGRLLAAAGDAGERLLVVNLDLKEATLGEAEKRHTHPLFREFWDTGVAILAETAHERAARGMPPGNDTGRKPGDPQPRYRTEHKPLVSPDQVVKIAAAQLACSQRMDENVATMVAMIASAARENADVVVFPELAVTGARESDIRAASQSDIEQALARLRQAAAKSKVYVAAGLPWRDGERLFNSAVVIDPQGQLLTRYDQIVVDRPELFAGGTSSKSMWFEIKGVPAVLTIGRDALWSEIAEMAALRGAQIHLHLAYDQETSVDAQRLRQQLWVNLASYNTFTATVNAATPDGLASRSAPAAGGSILWEDFRRTKAGLEGGYFPHSATALAKAGRNPTILYATQQVAKTNPQFARMISPSRNPQMTPWYTVGARAIYAVSNDSNLARVPSARPGQ